MYCKVLEKFFFFFLGRGDVLYLCTRLNRPFSFSPPLLFKRLIQRYIC